MPRIRSIHPDACDSEKLSMLSAQAERTLWRLITHTDDEGRGEDRPKLLAAKLYPLVDDIDGADIDRDLDELQQVGMLVRYQVGGKRFYAVPTFGDWQKPRHPTPSKFPSPEEADGPTEEPDGSPTADRGNGTADLRSPTAGEGGVSGEGDGGGEGDSTSPPAGGDPNVSADAQTLTREFARAVKANGHPIPSKGTRARDEWLIAMDRLLRLGPPGEGGHVPDTDEVRKVIAFVTADDFEAPNVQSVPKLRKRYSQLRLKALNGQARASPASRPSEFTKTRRLQ